MLHHSKPYMSLQQADDGTCSRCAAGLWGGAVGANPVNNRLLPECLHHEHSGKAGIATHGLQECPTLLCMHLQAEMRCDMPMRHLQGTRQSANAELMCICMDKKPESTVSQAQGATYTMRAFRWLTLEVMSPVHCQGASRSANSCIAYCNPGISQDTLFEKQSQRRWVALPDCPPVELRLCRDQAVSNGLRQLSWLQWLEVEVPHLDLTRKHFVRPVDGSPCKQPGTMSLKSCSVKPCAGH